MVVVTGAFYGTHLESVTIPPFAAGLPLDYDKASYQGDPTISAHEKFWPGKHQIFMDCVHLKNVRSWASHSALTPCTGPHTVP